MPNRPGVVPRPARSAALAAVTLLAIASPAAAQADAADAARLEPLAFLVGSCWKGTFPDGVATDEHCYEWMLGGEFVRDRHVVLGQGDGPYHGETVFGWDPEAEAIVYWYFNGHGDVATGRVEPDGDRLVFPERVVTEEGVRELRTIWSRPATDRIAVVVEETRDGAWTELWSMTMGRQGGP